MTNTIYTPGHNRNKMGPPNPREAESVLGRLRAYSRRPDLGDPLQPDRQVEPAPFPSVPARPRPCVPPPRATSGWQDDVGEGTRPPSPRGNARGRQGDSLLLVRPAPRTCRPGRRHRDVPGVAGGPSPSP